MQVKNLIPAQTAPFTMTMWIAPHEIGSLLQLEGGAILTDVIAIEQVGSDGSYTPIVLNTYIMTLDADNTQRKLVSINKIRINKPTTSNAVGVSMITP